LRQKKSTLGEHLALLSVKYNVYPNEVLQGLIAAKEAGKSVCEDLSIEYRGQVKDEHIFLLKKEGNVVAQFRVDDEFLERKDAAFESYMKTDKIRKKMAKNNPEVVFTPIQHLRTGMKRVNVKAQVLEIPKPSQVHTQFGNTVMMVNAIIGDDTEKIKLCLWEGQINAVVVSDNIEIKNAQVCAFRGERQLRLGKKGVLTVVPKPGAESNQQVVSPPIVVSK
jgi:hypothetical protein